MNRERLAWLVSLVLLVILAFQLPRSIGQRDSDMLWLRPIAEVHRLVLEDYVDPVNDSLLQQNAIDGMLDPLGDPFTDYIPPAQVAEVDKELGGSFSGVGIFLREINKQMVVVSPVQGGPADRAGIDSGDIIVKVNGQSITGLPIDQVVQRVSGPEGSPVTLTVRRSDKDIDFTLNRQQIQVPTVFGYQRNPDESWNYFVCQNPKIAYLRISQFDQNTFGELKAALAGGNGQPGLLAQGMRGLILDLRFNPGGQLQQAIDVVNLFVKQGVIVSTHGRNSPEEIDRADGKETLPSFPMIVLVNDDSASAAEIVAGSLQDNHRALVLGQRTYGKGSVQRVIPLGDNDGTLKITVAHWYLPSGRLVSRTKGSKVWGVDPQIVVPVEPAGELAIHALLERQEAIRYHPLPTTQPATQPTTMLVDPQFQQALTTMAGMIILDNNQHGPAAPATLPATVPLPVAVHP